MFKKLRKSKETSTFLDTKLEISTVNEKEESADEELKLQMDKLNAYLEYADTIKMDVCFGNKREYEYEIANYKLSFIDKYLFLYLIEEDTGREFRPKISKILDICFDPSSKRIKVWLYRENDEAAVRFYIENIQLPDIEIKAYGNEKYIREVVVKEYDKYKYENPLLYKLEQEKDQVGKQLIYFEKFALKNGGDYYLTLETLGKLCDKTAYVIKFIDEFSRAADELDFSLYCKPIVHLVIEDILFLHKDKGVGSNAMNILLNFAKENHVKEISGILSSVDNDHEDRRNHFYKKFGFTLNSKYIIKKFE